ncbi:MAG TPA: hypothetical protein VJ689_11195 [Gaiellaceae bacterium]|nr:hypothetical protein [Gaiellaceae bacterium]
MAGLYTIHFPDGRTEHRLGGSAPAVGATIFASGREWAVERVDELNGRCQVVPVSARPGEPSHAA